MDHALAISGSKSNEATCSGDKRRRKVKFVAINDSREELTEMVETLKKMKNANGVSKSVLGFEVEYADSFGKDLPISGEKIRVSHLILSNGNIAYAIFLGIDPRLSEPLLCFLLDTEFSFVSMGMQLHLDNLDQRYEACCYNTFDLGQLASKLKGNPRLRCCGIDLLAKGIGMCETPRPTKVVLKKGFERLYRMVDEEKLLKAVANTCVFHEIGKALLCC